MPTFRVTPRAEFRFYAELNDSLPPHHRRSFFHRFEGTPTVKDAIESLGVAKTVVDLVLVDGKSVGFDYRLTGGERVAVYPVFERFDISSINRLRPRPLRDPRFIADARLGALARHLRRLGYDTADGAELDDATIVRRSVEERRIVLTRDPGLLQRTDLTHGYALRATRPREQLEEVIAALDLRVSAKPGCR